VDHWQPREVIGLVVAVGLLLATLAWAAAWFAGPDRELELSGHGPEERAAQLLGRVIAGHWMTAKGVQEVMGAFNGLGPWPCMRWSGR
jgi:hypothetical protein